MRDMTCCETCSKRSACASHIVQLVEYHDQRLSIVILDGRLVYFEDRTDKRSYNSDCDAFEVANNLADILGVKQQVVRLYDEQLREMIGLRKFDDGDWEIDTIVELVGREPVRCHG